MPLGPVFHAELMATSRRRRYYAIRLAYGLTLLVLVGWTYEETSRSLVTYAEPSHAWMARMATEIFGAFLVVQVSAVLCLTPALVAGAIADERRRKTLPDLLASPLSSFEIVVGKLAARMLQLVVLVASGLPVLSILTLFGGVDPPAVVAALVGALTTAFALAGLAIFVSAVARRPRDAIVITYLLELLWIAGPSTATLLLGLARSGVVRVATVMWLDPFQLVDLVTPGPGLFGRLAWMAAGQVLAGLALIALAVWRLRRASANVEPVRSAESWTRRRTPLPRHGPKTGWITHILTRPPVGDDPMAWKERHVARLGPVLRAIGRLATVVSAVFLAAALFDLARPAFAELVTFGYGDSPEVVHDARDELNDAIAMTAAAIAMIGIAGLALTTAAGIPAERDGDTWVSLLATPLTGDDILRGKALGAIHRWRAALAAALLLWTFGLVAGAINPLGYALTLALFASYTAFALALGSFVSLHARSTTRAVVWTIAVLFVLNGGYLMCLVPIGGHGSLFTTPLMPYRLAVAPEPTTTRAADCVASLLGYGFAAAVLGGIAADGFDRAADRPRRPPGYSVALAEALEAATDD